MRQRSGAQFSWLPGFREPSLDFPKQSLAVPLPEHEAVLSHRIAL